jgi:beta-N-acetylhexosaminidase
MTGHLQVPALDPDHIATVSRTITRDLLRGALAFTGTIVTDALEMRAVADGVGMVEGAIGALAAGADTIETGAQDHPQLATAIPDAIVRAVQEGRLDEGRVIDAATRTAALATPADTTHVPVPDAATVEILGTLPRLVRPLVVECRTPGGMASGELPWSLGAHLAPLLPGTRTLQVDHAVELPSGRDVVLVVRDPDRVPWQRALLSSATVVVDCGWPGPPSDRPTIRTRGIAPGLLEHAARALVEGAR